MPIERWPVGHSSNISEVEHDSELNLMTVTFASGARYALSGVPATTASDLANDPSPGSFYARHIRDRYPTRKI